MKTFHFVQRMIKKNHTLTQWWIHKGDRVQKKKKNWKRLFTSNRWVCTLRTHQKLLTNQRTKSIRWYSNTNINGNFFLGESMLAPSYYVTVELYVFMWICFCTCVDIFLHLPTNSSTASVRHLITGLHNMMAPPAAHPNMNINVWPEEK